jgi:hypothetical protein
MDTENVTAETNDIDNSVDNIESSVAEDDKDAKIEFTDTHEDSTDKANQTKEQNSEFARRRREQEQKKLIAQEREKARVEAIIELQKTNEFTGEALTDSEDVQLYLEMKKYKEQGGDPISDMHKIIKSMKTKEAEKQSNDDKITNDIEKFRKEYPSVNVEELFSDKRFEKFAEGKLETQSLSKIYADYQEFAPAPKTKEERKQANKQASVGSLKGNSTSKPTMTIDSIKQMSREEINANWELVRKIISNK